MSSSYLIIFVGNKQKLTLELRNSLGTAPIVWGELNDKYIAKPGDLHSSWLSNAMAGGPLWKLTSDPRLTDCEKAMLLFTCDRCYVKAENFIRFNNDIKTFLAMYDLDEKGKNVNHWPRIAECCIDPLEGASAYGLHPTTVTESPWDKYNEETDENEEYTLDDDGCAEVYDLLAELSK